MSFQKGRGKKQLGDFGVAGTSSEKVIYVFGFPDSLMIAGSLMSVGIYHNRHQAFLGTSSVMCRGAAAPGEILRFGM